MKLEESDRDVGSGGALFTSYLDAKAKQAPDTDDISWFQLNGSVKDSFRLGETNAAG